MKKLGNASEVPTYAKHTVGASRLTRFCHVGLATRAFGIKPDPGLTL